MRGLLGGVQEHIFVGLGGRELGILGYGILGYGRWEQYHLIAILVRRVVGYYEQNKYKRTSKNVGTQNL